MHGVHGGMWSVCVGWEDRKMTARLMKRSGTTLMRDGGKAEGGESEEKEACARSHDQEKRRGRKRKELGRTEMNSEEVGDFWRMQRSLEDC